MQITNLVYYYTINRLLYNNKYILYNYNSEITCEIIQIREDPP